eukprot:TRINITY_DN18059_c0_g1_i3.p1 TRINITY_DN18059_c0_g1~~TRINITY_DN18059_c0_g1_i3.p1  ORF type:complete len:422 (+),score=122.77 TRINITY_DN18059_c0_g1_i3:241-1506(+)
MSSAEGISGSDGSQQQQQKQQQRMVLLLDMDCFFCQVHAKEDPSLEGIPVVVQQHGDIIAVDYQAREMGVTKHMNPNEARRLVAEHGVGRVVHAFEEQGKVSYRKYLDASTSIHKLLIQISIDRFGSTTVCEKASIDEFFVDLSEAWWSQHEVAGVSYHEFADTAATSLTKALIQHIGYKSSTGVACCKILAKAAASRAKPNGHLVVGGSISLQEMLWSTPVSAAPGCGYKSLLLPKLKAIGIQKLSELATKSVDQLQKQLGISAQLARQLHDFGLGVDPRPVLESPAPTRVSVHMSLGPELRGVTSNPFTSGERCQPKLEQMAKDLVVRVEQHLKEFQEWPSQLTLGACLNKQALKSTSGGYPERREDGAAVVLYIDLVVENAIGLLKKLMEKEATLIGNNNNKKRETCLLYTSPSPRDS